MKSAGESRLTSYCESFQIDMTIGMEGIRSLFRMAALGLVACALGCQRLVPAHEYPFPEFDRVVFLVRASGGDKESEIPSGDFPQLKAAFSAVQRDSQPAKWQTWGEEIHFYKGDSEVLSIRLFRDWQGVGPFSIQRQYFRGYDLERLRAVLPMRREFNQPIQ